MQTGIQPLNYYLWYKISLYSKLYQKINIIKYKYTYQCIYIYIYIYIYIIIYVVHVYISNILFYFNYILFYRLFINVLLFC